MNATELPSPDLPSSAIDAAAAHLRDVLAIALEHGPGRRALVVLRPPHRPGARAGRGLPPQPAAMPTSSTSTASTPDTVLAAFQAYAPGDLVVLVQSTNFRLDGFRLRVELFKLGLKVIEHVHLSRMPGAQGEHYIEALAYDPHYFRGVGHALKRRIDARARAPKCMAAARCWSSIRRSNRPS